MEVAHVVSMVINGLVLLVVGAVGWAVRTVNLNKERVSVMEAEMKAKADKTDLLESYVRRNDYITQMSLLGNKIDGMGERLVRIEERLGGR